MTPTRLSVLMTTIALTASCTKRKLETFTPEPAASSVSEVTMNLPDREALKGPNADKLNGFRLVVEPLDDSCDGATRIDRVEPWTTSRLDLSLIHI